MLASAGIQKVRGQIPSVIFETDKTIAINNPRPEARVDYLIFPKKDLRTIGDISEEDAPYLSDVYLVAKYIIDKEHLLRYRMYTNGPGYTKVAYLHFHLISK
jgi:histidine triad (HIT) family protein